MHIYIYEAQRSRLNENDSSKPIGQQIAQAQNNYNGEHNEELTDKMVSLVHLKFLL